MKCPYCGAEVIANTKCKYCDSYVEDVAAKQAASTGSTSKTENPGKALVRMILRGFGVVFGIKFGCAILMFVSTGLLLAAQSMLNEYEPESTYTSDVEETVTNEWVSVTDQEGNVKSFEYDGDITVETEDGIFETVLTDRKLLGWLEHNNGSIKGIDVLFSTDAKSNIDTLALASNVFYVLGEQDGQYLITRDGDFFKADTEAYLIEGCFYDGYFTYPDVSVYHANEIMQVNISLFDPVCKDKREVTVWDAYSDGEMMVWQIRTGDDWYYCSKELYDICEAGSPIEEDICIDREMDVIYVEE